MVGIMNVFVVENSTVMADSLQSMLSGIPGINVVGHSVDEQDAIKHIGTLLPEAVIMDIGLQSGSGFVLLENIKKLNAEIKVMVLTHYSGKDYADRCKNAGADYFFDKSYQLVEAREVLQQWDAMLPRQQAPFRQQH